MSIVVDCRECEASYKLPDRYAGKRCRCKGCKAKIEVPAEAKEPRTRKKRKKRKRAAEAVAVVTEAKPKRKKRSKAKDEAKAETKAEAKASKRGAEKAKRARAKKARRSATRRLGSQEDQIRAEGKALREKLAAGRRRTHSPTPVSESIHQLAPLNSGALDPVGLRPRKGKGKKGAAKKGTTKLERRTLARKRTAKLGREDEQGKKRGRKGTAKLGRKGTAKLGRGITKRGGKRTIARRGLARGARRGQAELDEGEELELQPKTNTTRYALFAVLALVGLLCLGVGLAVGGAFGDSAPAVSASEKKLDYIEALAWKGQWDVAQQEAEALEVTLQKSGDAAELATLSRLKVSVTNMVTIRSIEDDESKLDQLLRFVGAKEGFVRLGVAMELRPLAFLEEGSRALVTLTKDSDPRVVAAAKQALVQTGGPNAIPFLMEAIVDTAQTGGKLGDIAVERALELSEPEIVPVLVKILETRTKAKADVLRQALSNLTDLAEPEVAKKAAEPYLDHKDESVREAAEAASR